MLLSIDRTLVHRAIARNAGASVPPPCFPPPCKSATASMDAFRCKCIAGSIRRMGLPCRGVCTGLASLHKMPPSLYMALMQTIYFVPGCNPCIVHCILVPWYAFRTSPMAVETKSLYQSNRGALWGGALHVTWMLVGKHVISSSWIVSAVLIEGCWWMGVVVWLGRLYKLRDPILMAWLNNTHSYTYTPTTTTHLHTPDVAEMHDVCSPAHVELCTVYKQPHHTEHQWW